MIIDMTSGYSFPPISDPKARAARIAYLEGVLRAAEIPALREELRARLAEPR